MSDTIVRALHVAAAVIAVAVDYIVEFSETRSEVGSERKQMFYAF